jgi:hypothetical protein
MNLRAIAVVAVICVPFSLGAQEREVLQVVKVISPQPNTFEFGEKCIFETELTVKPVRLRIIRGQRAKLIEYGTGPRHSQNGCVEYYSTLIRPLQDDDEPEVLDLGFYLTEGWVSRDGGPGIFVAVVEHDPAPNGPRFRADRLRLPVGAAATYFASGIQFTVAAPRSITSPATLTTIGREDPANVLPCVDLRYDSGAPATLQADRPSSGSAIATAAPHPQ